LCYFVGASGLFVLQKPTSEIFTENNHEALRDSFYKIVPRLSGGISLRRGLIEFEPYFTFTYFKVNSQNFKFNYFGRADYEIVQKNFIQFGAGFSLNVAILNY
jgi:hypothetical protein